MKRILTACAVVTLPLLTPLPMRAQSVPSLARDQAAVANVVTRLFDGMHAGDSAMVRSAFAPGARFADADTSGGVAYMSPDRWITAIARSGGRWNEVVYDVEIHLDDNVAQVWAPYTFYLADTLSHCGIDTMELLRTTRGEWKITQLSDTHREQGCPDPRAPSP